MPLVRYEVRCEHSLANPELYRTAGQDDSEGLLEGVAMAGLVGIVRQLGDLAEFAAEIFDDLHDDMMTVVSRGRNLKARLARLEVDLPAVEKALLAESSQFKFAYSARSKWRAPLPMDQNLCAQNELPRFVRNFYDDCRGPPRLFLLDKFDEAGRGACVKRYTDPTVFRLSWAASQLTKAEQLRREREAKLLKNAAAERGNADAKMYARARLSSTLFENLEGFTGDFTPELRSRRLDRAFEVPTEGVLTPDGIRSPERTRHPHPLPQVAEGPVLAPLKITAKDIANAMRGRRLRIGLGNDDEEALSEAESSDAEFYVDAMTTMGSDPDSEPGSRTRWEVDSLQSRESEPATESLNHSVLKAHVEAHLVTPPEESDEVDRDGDFARGREELGNPVAGFDTVREWEDAGGHRFSVEEGESGSVDETVGHASVASVGEDPRNGLAIVVEHAPHLNVLEEESLIPSKLPDKPPDKLPDTFSEKLPDTLSDQLPPALSDKLPDTLSEELPDTLSVTLPDTLPNTLSAKLPDTLSEERPHTLSEELPHTPSEELPYTLSDQLPPHLSDNLPRTLPDKRPHILSDKLPYTHSDKLPSTLPDKLPDTLPDKRPHILSEKLPDTLPNTLPNTPTDTLPDTPPDTLPDTPPDTPPDTLPDTLSDKLPYKRPDDKLSSVPPKNPPADGLSEKLSDALSDKGSDKVPRKSPAKAPEPLKPTYQSHESVSLQERFRPSVRVRPIVASIEARAQQSLAVTSSKSQKPLAGKKPDDHPVVVALKQPSSPVTTPRSRRLWANDNNNNNAPQAKKNSSQRRGWTNNGTNGAAELSAILRSRMLETEGDSTASSLAIFGDDPERVSGHLKLYHNTSSNGSSHMSSSSSAAEEGDRYTSSDDDASSTSPKGLPNFCALLSPSESPPRAAEGLMAPPKSLFLTDSHFDRRGSARSPPVAPFLSDSPSVSRSPSVIIKPRSVGVGGDGVNRSGLLPPVASDSDQVKTVGATSPSSRASENRGPLQSVQPSRNQEQCSPLPNPVPRPRTWVDRSASNVAATLRAIRQAATVTASDDDTGSECRSDCELVTEPKRRVDNLKHG